MIHFNFLLRELVQSRNQAGIFTLCVALSIATMVGLNSFKHDVNQTITGDARALHGGDIILHSHYEFSPGLVEAVARQESSIAAQTRSWEFYSVVRNPVTEATRFSNILVVEPGYPLYGEVTLQSGKELSAQLQPGTTVVAPELLEILGLTVGASLQVGDELLRITDVVVRESSRPIDVFNFGPRVFVAAADLEQLDLVKPGSRVEYEWLLKVADPAQMSAVETALSAGAVSGQERVATYQNARSGLKRFFDNLLFFLSLISIFTLLLAGVGMQSSLAALLREKEKSLAITRALGATQKFLLSHYLLLVLLYGSVGSVLGILAGVAIKHSFPALFAGLIPAENIGGLGVREVVNGMLLGLAVVCFFTFLPLYRLRDVKPNVIFRSESAESRRGAVFYFFVVIGLALLGALVVVQLQDIRIGVYFMAGMIGLIVLVALLARLLLLIVAKLPIKGLKGRQAVRSLLRPGNSTRSVVVTLASAISVLLAIFLLEYNLHRNYVESYPEEAPNLFLVDIQPSQRVDFVELVGDDVQLYPIIRARLRAINGEPVKRGERRSRFSDSLSREFNLTYRDALLEDEVVEKGEALYKLDGKGNPYLQVSILDTVAEMGSMRLGDMLDFNIQGVPIKAEVTSIRTRTKSMLFPFFYFVFPEQYLKEAPQTLFAAMHVEESEITSFEGEVVSRFPNVSIINMARTAEELGEVMGKLSGIVNFFAFFSIFAGALIIISSVLATRLARTREAVYYKILGGGSKFVIAVFFYENLLLGFLSACLGVALAQAGGWALCHYLFDIGYEPNWPVSLALVGVTLMMVVGVGMFSSISIIRQKPGIFLREQSVE
ncbi:ABC transporter permease [Desulfosediminicola sp.]|uniref:ABC transporter permease n=1 Tax=Desulfosediminicola sp. TaxID=2886825 RepID=UPI003AF29A39